jgi:glycosyltransferase involved in cell wall biosynthesis
MTTPIVAGEGGPSRSAGLPAAVSHRLSVALCTWNGARFLEPQLESLSAQSRAPDELVVCDDASTDDTVAILTRFAQGARFPVRIERNPTRLGSTKNFEKAIGLCTGDLIATCDQDDIWLPDKLAWSEAAMDGPVARGLVFTDSEVVDDELQPLGHTMWDAIRFSALARRQVRCGRPFDVLLKQWIVTGATMMFRADYRPFVLPIPDNWIHDGWIAFIIGALAPIGFIERPTLKYRQHVTQQIGGRKLGFKALFRIAREMGPAYFHLHYERFQLAYERLATCALHLRDPGVLAQVQRKVAHQQHRLAISETSSRCKRALWAVAELLRGGYWRYSPGPAHFFKDLLL